MPPAEARAAAYRKLGNRTLIREEIYRMNSLGFLETLWQDIRYGWRMLRKSPGFTVVAALTLALGIGANTAIFSMVDWLLFQQLPVQDPKAITYLGFAMSGSRHNDNQFSFPEYQEMSKQCGAEFDGISAFTFGGAAGSQMGPDGLTYQGKTLPLQSIFVTGNFFSMLGIQPELGRFFTADEGNTPNADPVVVLAYDLWHSRFQGDRQIIGQQVAVNGHAFTVIGVAPKGFYGPTPVMRMEAYLPLGMLTVEAGHPANFLTKADVRSLVVIARLKHGDKPEQVQPVLSVVGQRLLAQNPRPDEKLTVLHAVPLRPPALMNTEGPNPAIRFSLLLLTLGALVLGLSCVNVVNLLLVRGTTRQGEIAVRAALGAARGRLVRQLLTESVLLATLGCLGGIAVGVLGMRALALASMQAESALPIRFDLQFSWLVFTYACAVALIAGIVVGIVPALRVARANLNPVLRETGRTTTGRRQRVRDMLVAAQVASSLVLLTAAGLFMRSLQAAQRVDLGFDPQNVLNMTLDPNQIGYSQTRGQEFYQRLLERVRATPGVESASLAALVPMGDTEMGGNINVPGFEAVKGQPHPGALYNAVSPGYFATMRMALLRGREFTESVSAKNPRVAIINEIMAEKYWHGQDPLGRQFFTEDEPARPIQVIGVMKNSRNVDTYSPIEPTYFVPLAQHYFSTQTLQVRSRGVPPDFTRQVLALVDSLAPAMPVFGVRTMSQALNSLNGLFGFQLAAWLTGVLGLVGLLLAMIGVYGVMSYSVSQRTHEIGVRMALGAQRGRIMRTVGVQGLWVVAAGLTLGLLLAAGVSQLVKDFVIGISSMDAVTYLS
ncbi:MAG: ABC transporter permease, partial [Terriglobales bacterium]